MKIPDATLQLIALYELAQGMSKEINGMEPFAQFFFAKQSEADRRLLFRYAKIRNKAVGELTAYAKADAAKEGKATR